MLNSFVIILFNLLVKKAKANKERVSYIINAKNIKKKICQICFSYIYILKK
jgi:hypothetical protein